MRLELDSTKEGGLQSFPVETEICIILLALFTCTVMQFLRIAKGRTSPSL